MQIEFSYLSLLYVFLSFSFLSLLLPRTAMTDIFYSFDDIIWLLKGKG